MKSLRAAAILPSRPPWPGSALHWSHSYHLAMSSLIPSSHTLIPSFYRVSPLIPHGHCFYRCIHDSLTVSPSPNPDSNSIKLIHRGDICVRIDHKTYTYTHSDYTYLYMKILWPINEDEQANESIGSGSGSLSLSLSGSSQYREAYISMEREDRKTNIKTSYFELVDLNARSTGNLWMSISFIVLGIPTRPQYEAPLCVHASHDGTGLK